MSDGKPQIEVIDLRPPLEGASSETPSTPTPGRLPPKDLTVEDLRPSSWAAQTGLYQHLEPASPAVPTDVMAVVERLAANPQVDVEKLERVITLLERIQAFQARAGFERAFAQMQPELPEISEKGQIVVKGQLRSTYAKLEDIQAAIKPVLTRYGFALRHCTEWPDKANVIRIVGILCHEQGHSERSVFEAPMDKSEYRTDIQSMGSTVSYGRRYTTIDLLNLTTRGQDNDGATAGRPGPPDGYLEWFPRLLGAADRGVTLLQAGWAEAPAAFKQYVVKYDKAQWDTAKTTARAVDDAGARSSEKKGTQA